MNKMFKEYKVFATRKTRFISFISMVAVFLFSILFSCYVMGMIPLMGITMTSMFTAMALGTVDFFIFGGVAVKGQIMMDFVKSSFNGNRVVKKALRQDVYINMARVVGLSVISMIVADIINYKTICPGNLIYVVALSFTSLVILYFIQILTRKFAKTLTSHIGCMYVISLISSALLIVPLMVYELFADPANLQAIRSVSLMGYLYIVLAAVASVGLGELLIWICYKGYMSGYSDR